ncbi:hypothetical protein B566_EDAN015166 [Ephemera danica]|nr:hypothetical protein B566_EDAN015166 [Ephemera danica]
MEHVLHGSFSSSSITSSTPRSVVPVIEEEPHTQSPYSPHVPDVESLRADGFYRPPQTAHFPPNYYHHGPGVNPPKQQQPVDPNGGGIFSSISSGFNNLVSNIFG